MTASLPIPEASLFLVVAQGAHKGAMIPVKGPQFLIGRHSSCHMRPTSPAVSLHHCVLLVRQGRFFVSDLNSESGTFLNDRQVVGEVEVLDQDRLRAGPLQLVIRVPAAAPAAVNASTEVEAVEETADLTSDSIPVDAETADLTSDSIPADAEDEAVQEASSAPAAEPVPPPAESPSHRARAILRRYSARRHGNA